MIEDFLLRQYDSFHRMKKAAISADYDNIIPSKEGHNERRSDKNHHFIQKNLKFKRYEKCNMILFKTWKKTQLCHQQCWKVKTGGGATNANFKLREKKGEGQIFFSNFSTNKSAKNWVI